MCNHSGMPSASDTSSAETVLADVSPAEIRETALRVGALSRWLYTFGSSSEAFRVAEEHGLSFMQMKLMLEVGTRGSDATPYLQELAEQLGTNMPSVSRGVDSLVRSDLMTRVEDPDDRRRRRVALTADGKKVVEAFLSARVSGAKQFAATLTADQRDGLNAAIDALLENEDFNQTFTQIEEVFPA